MEMLEWFFKVELSKLDPITIALTRDEHILFQRFFIHILREQYQDVSKTVKTYV